MNYIACWTLNRYQNGVLWISATSDEAARSEATRAVIRELIDADFEGDFEELELNVYLVEDKPNATPSLGDIEAAWNEHEVQRKAAQEEYQRKRDLEDFERLAKKLNKET